MRHVVSVRGEIGGWRLGRAHLSPEKSSVNPKQTCSVCIGQCIVVWKNGGCVCKLH